MLHHNTGSLFHIHSANHMQVTVSSSLLVALIDFGSTKMKPSCTVGMVSLHTLWTRNRKVSKRAIHTPWRIFCIMKHIEWHAVNYRYDTFGGLLMVRTISSWAVLTSVPTTFDRSSTLSTELSPSDKVILKSMLNRWCIQSYRELLDLFRHNRSIFVLVDIIYQHVLFLLSHFFRQSLSK